jgi:RecB family endonuclease NucS
MRLWGKGSGYEAAALDLLVQRCKSWYAHRQQTRRIKRGDRVAILGKDIALVEHVNDKHAHVLPWNQNVLRIGCKEIVWDEGNARWEARIQSSVAEDCRPV